MIDDTSPAATEVGAGPVWSEVMGQGPEKDTTRIQISSDVLDQMEKDLAAGKLWDKLKLLDSIREEFGIGWAIYLSAFMGPAVNDWRVDVCEALNE